MIGKKRVVLSLWGTALGLVGYRPATRRGAEILSSAGNTAIYSIAERWAVFTATSVRHREGERLEVGVCFDTMRLHTEGCAPLRCGAQVVSQRSTIKDVAARS